jgi:hypothetical protein
MSELVLWSKYAAGTHAFRVIVHRNGDFGVRVSVPDAAITGLTLSADDTRKLRDFLNKELGEQAPEPTVSGPWVYLETDSKGNNWWSQYPTRERAQKVAMKRTSFKLETQMIGFCHQTLVPVTVTTTSYEWKEIG